MEHHCPPQSLSGREILCHLAEFIQVRRMDLRSFSADVLRLFLDLQHSLFPLLSVTCSPSLATLVNDTQWKWKLRLLFWFYPTEPLMVIVEFCAYGDLQSYLRHCRGVEDKYYQDLYKVPADKLGSRDLLSFAIQTARGMAHLAGMKVWVIRRIGL